MRKLFWCFALFLSLLSGGCVEQRTPLTILAGSELKDLEPFITKDVAREIGQPIVMKYTGTLEGAEQIMSGQQIDIAWFSHAKYMTLLDAGKGRIVAQERIMLSPVIMGVKEGLARKWGWVGKKDLTWRDISRRAASGELRYAMTDPTSSNSGFTAVLGVTAALSNRGDAVRAEDVDKRALADFFKGQKLTAGSSGWLAEVYVREQEKLDGIINYESVLLQLNSGTQLSEKLYLVYPKEGIVTADYPIMLINSGKREQFAKIVQALRTIEFQEKIMIKTLRRPVVPQVALNNSFPQDILVELPFPSTSAVIDKLLFSYLDETRRPSHAFLVLDVSGSMEGERLHSLKGALSNLTGLDRSLTGQFSRFRTREKITVIPFSDRVQEGRTFQIKGTGANDPSMREIRDYIDQLRAGGGTAIYSALQEAYRMAADARAKDPDRFYTVVLMTDGANNKGISGADFTEFYRRLPEEARGIRAFTILFGEASEKELGLVAELTGGKVFDGQRSLSTAFKSIRGYQ